MNKLKTLEELLQNHDWFYQYSDDYGVYEHGQNAWKTISKVMEALDDAGSVSYTHLTLPTNREV